MRSKSLIPIGVLILTIIGTYVIWLWISNIIKSKEVDPIDYEYKLTTCANVYFNRENKDSIFLVFKEGSHIGFRCENNGIIYYYTVDSSLLKKDTVIVYDTIKAFIDYPKFRSIRSIDSVWGIQSFHIDHVQILNQN